MNGFEYLEYEYFVDEVPRDRDASVLQKRLNELGAEGWELVSVNENMLDYSYIFRRTIRMGSRRGTGTARPERRYPGLG